MTASEQPDNTPMPTYSTQYLMAHHISTRRFAALVALALPVLAAAETLCRKDETDYFSCKVVGGQLISVCGRIHDEPKPEDWLQYRRGLPRRLEMVWPLDRRESLGKFGGNVFGPYSVSDLRFEIGDTTYGISLSRGGEDDRAGGRTRRGAGVHMTRAGDPDVTRECMHPDIARYGQSFEALNILLVNGRGAAGLR